MDSANDDRRDHQEERAFKDFVNDVENHAQILVIHRTQLDNQHRLLTDLCEDVAELKRKAPKDTKGIQG